MPDELKFIGFKADAEAMAALARLVAALPPGTHRGRGRSAAIRRALLEAESRLPPPTVEQAPSGKRKGKKK